MHCIVLDDLCVLVWEVFHARCIGMHKSFHGKELMYTFTAGLHMIFCGILLCIRYALNDLYVYVSKRILEHMHIFTVIYIDSKCFMNVLFTSSATPSLKMKK